MPEDTEPVDFPPDTPGPQAHGPRAALYERITQELEARAGLLWDVALRLHGTPEPAYEEHQAAALLTGELQRGGFAVRRGVADLPTAFVAESAGSGSARPRVALVLEYDALPELGHACGHNLIAGAGLGAALALHSALRAGPEGTEGGSLTVIGSPAEEGGGGKVAQVAAGVFDGVDAALMFHPGTHSWSWAPLTAQVQVEVTFHGRAAHPTGNPAEGVDALAALIQLFTALDVLQRRLPPGSHVQGIVTEGGRATNIVPDLAQGRFGLRAATTVALEGLVSELGRCADGIATATGTRAEVARVGTGYQHFRDNEVLSERFARHLARAGITAGPPEPGVYLGSSDMGDVSTVVPAIHPFVAITGPEGADHTPEFARAAASEQGRRAMLASARALACTAADVLLEPGLCERSWARWREKAAAGL
ncbi:amidohydrolase [Streptomyces sp. NPDC046215]|uniref:Peptidase M20 domain-containing protein 2 n=1 Tax=Streptomyces stramineus TaxID=173861 RepID=A0ABN1AIU4_9ACTN